MADDYKPGRGQRIDKLYAWVASEADGGEGLCAARTPGMDGLTPLIGADRARIESYRPLAQEVAHHIGCKVRLKLFVATGVIDEL